MDLIERYYLIVYGAFDREPMIFDERPTQECIEKAIKDLDGKSAKVEKRFVLGEDK